MPRVTDGESPLGAGLRGYAQSDSPIAPERYVCIEHRPGYKVANGDPAYCKYGQKCTVGVISTHLTRIFW